MHFDKVKGHFIIILRISEFCSIFLNIRFYNYNFQTSVQYFEDNKIWTSAYKNYMHFLGFLLFYFLSVFH